MIPVSVIIPVKNEEKNVGKCLNSISNFAEIIVVDSGSVDNTKKIAVEHGAKVIDFAWNGKFPKKRNWCLKNLHLKNEWLLFLDADECLDENVIKKIASAIVSDRYNGYWLCFDNYFMGKRLRYGDKMRKIALLKKGYGEYEHIKENNWSNLDMEVHEHIIVDGEIGIIKAPVAHNDFKSLQAYIQKHNEYSNWEAMHLTTMSKEYFDGLSLRRKIKYFFMRSWSFGIMYFIFSYIIKGGFLDGKSGLTFAIFKFIYFFQIKCKCNELSRKKK